MRGIVTTGLVLVAFAVAAGFAAKLGIGLLHVRRAAAVGASHGAGKAGEFVSPESSWLDDVLPVLTKAGCNQGACHGAARGKDGFHLSLRGYDPAGDHYRLLRERPGRRIDLDAPQQSLLVLKATGRLPHSGGGRIRPLTPEYETLVRWIEEGSVDDTATAPRLAALRFETDERLVMAPGETRSLRVLATYSSGRERDVTRLCQFKSSDPAAAEVDADGGLTAVATGETFVTAALNPMIVGVHVVVPRPPAPADAVWPEPRSEIDRHVFEKLRNLNVVPSPVCDDRAFCRRVHVDLAARLPTSEELRAFEQDADPEKRRRLVERLVTEEAFVDVWTAKWADRLRLLSKPPLGVSAKGARLFHGWIREQIRRGTPLDAFATAMLVATGPGYENPAAHFYQFETDTLNTAEDVAQVFLGLRLKCARCHNHPFDRWTQDDYYGFAAFFAHVSRKKTADPREFSISVDRSGKLEHPLDKRVVEPRLPDGRVPAAGERDRRAVLAEWLASPGNPWFARHMANVVWEQHFGRGIVDPVDDARISNPPVNEPLLEALAARLVADGFDLRRLTVEICTSTTYQLSSLPNETNENEQRNFARFPVRRLAAEVLLDAIADVTESPAKLPRLELGASAVRLADGADSTPFLMTFGRAPRRSVCACEASTDPTLSQSLHLVNGDTVNDRITEGKVVRRLLGEGRTPEEVAHELHLRCLARAPHGEELGELHEALATGDDAAVVLEDLFWALLNSKEFLFQR